MLGWFVKALAVFIMAFALEAYQGRWKQIGCISISVIYNSIPWLLGITWVGLLVFAFGGVIGGNTFDFRPRVSKDSIAQCIKALIIGVIFVTIGAAVLVYFGHLMASKNNPNFDLAIISATIGGLVMVSGFIDKADKQQASELINIGKWFLIASVFSTLFSLFMPALAGMPDSDSGTLGYQLLFYATAVSLTVSAFSLPWAICLLLPKLWQLGQASRDSKQSRV